MSVLPPYLLFYSRSTTKIPTQGIHVINRNDIIRYYKMHDSYYTKVVNRARTLAHTRARKDIEWEREREREDKIKYNTESPRRCVHVFEMMNECMFARIRNCLPAPCACLCVCTTHIHRCDQWSTVFFIHTRLSTTPWRFKVDTFIRDLTQTPTNN